jgi:hypothetical protein
MMTDGTTKNHSPRSGVWTQDGTMRDHAATVDQSSRQTTVHDTILGVWRHIGGSGSDADTFVLADNLLKTT